MILWLIKIFLETFKNKSKRPALVLKTHIGSSSIPDREELLKRIEQIKDTVNSKNLPNIYLIHGDLTDQEMNELASAQIADLSTVSETALSDEDIAKLQQQI